MAKKITDEKLLEMLLVHGGASGAAAALGTDHLTVHALIMWMIIH